MLHKATITIGTGFYGKDNNYAQINDMARGHLWVQFRKALDKTVPAYQVRDTRGSWYDKEQELFVRETCLAVTIFQEKGQSYEAFETRAVYLAGGAKKLFVQDEVPVEITELKAVIWA